MKNKNVFVPPLKSLINKAPGFAKKQLADYKLDILALCGFGCLYCSSNTGNYLRINQKKFAACAKKQLGKAVKPTEDPSLMMVWTDVVAQLEKELEDKPTDYGKDKTLMFSMLTDGFSPYLVKEGITRNVLELVLEKTSFRIRVLTKNAIVGDPEWIEFFVEHKDRFVVGLSTGSLDDTWSLKMELGTSKPSERFAALADLQKAGVPTFGMLCPVFPSMLEDGSLEKMVELINPNHVEHIWAEPYNDRINWKIVRNSFDPSSSTYLWFTDVYEKKLPRLWSKYTTDLYLRLKAHAIEHQWLSKLRYLLYEDKITANDVLHYSGLEGVLLQSKPNQDGVSQNPHIANLQPQGNILAAVPGDQIHPQPNRRLEVSQTATSKSRTAQMSKLTQSQITKQIKVNMKQIDINNMRTIDFYKTLDDTKSSKFDETSIEWNKAFKEVEPSAYTIVGLSKIKDKRLAQKMIQIFFNQLRHHSHHVVSIEREAITNVLMDSEASLKVPKNVWILDHINQSEELQELVSIAADDESPGVVHLTLPLVDLEPKHLKSSGFVILEMNGALTQVALDQSREILNYCNPNNIPVWCFNKQARGEVIKNEFIDISAPHPKAEDMYFDLPKHRGYQFIDNTLAIENEAKDLGNSIVDARNRAIALELEIGYRLYGLDILARANGNNQFWRQNLQVKNRNEYCRIELGLPGTLGAQYINAVRNIETLKPGFLEQFFDSESENEGVLPHGYTRYRDLQFHIPKLIRLKNHPRYNELEDMIFGPGMSGRQLQLELKQKIDEFYGVDESDQNPDGNIGTKELPDDGGSAMQDQEGTISAMSVQEAPAAEDSLSAEDIIEKFKYDMISMIPSEFVDLFHNYCETFHAWVNESKDEHVHDIAYPINVNEEFDDSAPWDREEGLVIS